MCEDAESPVARARAAYHRSNFEQSKAISLDYVRSTQQSHHHRSPNGHSCFQLSACLLLAIKSWATIANDTKLEQRAASVEEDLLPVASQCNSLSSPLCLLSNYLPADSCHNRFNGSLKSFYDLVAAARTEIPLVSLLTDPLLLLRLCELCLDAELYDYAVNFGIQLHIAASRDNIPDLEPSALVNGKDHSDQQSDETVGKCPAHTELGNPPPTGLSESLWLRLVELHSPDSTLNCHKVNGQVNRSGGLNTASHRSALADLVNQAGGDKQPDPSPIDNGDWLIAPVDHPHGDFSPVGEHASTQAPCDLGVGDDLTSVFADLISTDPADDLVITGEQEEGGGEEERNVGYLENCELDRLLEFMVPTSLDVPGDEQSRRQFELLVSDGQQSAVNELSEPYEDAEEPEAVVIRRKSILKLPPSLSDQPTPGRSAGRRVRFSLDKNHPSPALEALYGGRSYRVRMLDFAVRRQRAELAAANRGNGSTGSSAGWPLSALWHPVKQQVALAQAVVTGLGQRLGNSTPLVIWCLLLTLLFSLFSALSFLFFIV